jgi:hypothetical protein
LKAQDGGWVGVVDWRSIVVSEEVRIVKLDDVSPDIAEESWSLYWAETKSTSAYFERFLREPLAVLKDEIPGVDDTWHVSTNVVNAHVPLTQNTVCRVSMVMPDEKLVLNLLYKHPQG